jgi:4-amino-4-deoxy-L-arabinose transferase-like glycosyltransferase
MSRSETPERGTSWRRLLVVVAIWAAIYLPALGSLELKGEEGRRILPAVAMLENGDWIVPQIGGAPYVSKPPLVNWLVAGSFALFGAQNEWTARLPSAVSVLLLALTLLYIAQPALGSRGSFFAALMSLTSFALVSKGRLIEIEALYTCLFGVAFVCWLTWWQQQRSSWLTWTVPFLFLGLGFLAKGPLHLLFFYSLVVAILLPRGELRLLLRPAHFAGVALMLGLFAAWAIPHLQMTEVERTTSTWAQQLSGRVVADFDWNNWLWNIPRGVAYALPWIPLVVLARTAMDATPQGRLARSLSWGIAVPFFAILLLPGAHPRYVMPLLAPTIWVLVIILTTPALIAPRFPLAHRLLAATRPRFVVGLACAVAAAMLIYSVAMVPFLKKREKIRNIAREVQAAIPTGERLYAIAPDYQPFLFYIRSPIIYVANADALPTGARAVLFDAQKEAQITTTTRWQTAAPRELLRIPDYRRKTVVLYDLQPPQ